jgi:hypothetical protein
VAGATNPTKKKKRRRTRKSVIQGIILGYMAIKRCKEKNSASEGGRDIQIIIL